MSKVLNNKNFLDLLTKSNRKKQKILVQNASNEEIKSICEIILNLLKGNLKIDQKDFNKLHKKKKILRNLVKRGSYKSKKFLIQKGGFLQVLIPAIVSGLASVLSSFIRNETRSKMDSGPLQ